MDPWPLSDKLRRLPPFSREFPDENRRKKCDTLRQILLRFSLAPRAVTPVTDITERAMAVTRPMARKGLS